MKTRDRSATKVVRIVPFVSLIVLLVIVIFFHSDPATATIRKIPGLVASDLFDETDPIDDFVITVKTDNPGTSSSTEFIIPTHPDGNYNYNVDCEDDGSIEMVGVTDSFTCTYTTPLTYTIRIMNNMDSGNGFPRIYFNNEKDADKLLAIKQWGTGQWTSMEKAFYGCSYLSGQAKDTPDLSNVTDMSYMFANANSFNQDIGNWDTSHVKKMRSLFMWANSFNKDIRNWNTSNVTEMRSMFFHASAFDQDIGTWNVSSLTYARDMFTGVELSTANYDALLIGWGSQTLQNGVTFHGGNSKFCRGEGARDGMIDTYSWSITDGERDPACIVGLNATNDSPTLLGETTTMTATIASGSGVSYDWDFGDSYTDTGAVVSHPYNTAGVYGAVVTATNTLNIVTDVSYVTIYEDLTLLPGEDTTTSDEVLTLEASLETSDAITLTYTPQISSTHDAGTFTFAGAYFNLDAIDELGNPITDLTYPITLTLSYDDDSLAAEIAEEELVLYRYDTDLMDWVELTGVVDTNANTVTVVLDHLSEFTLAVPEREIKIYLPLILR